LIFYASAENPYPRATQLLIIRSPNYRGGRLVKLCPVRFNAERLMLWPCCWFTKQVLNDAAGICARHLKELIPPPTLFKFPIPSGHGGKIIGRRETIAASACKRVLNRQMLWRRCDPKTQALEKQKAGKKKKMRQLESRYSSGLRFIAALKMGRLTPHSISGSKPGDSVCAKPKKSRQICHFDHFLLRWYCPQYEVDKICRRQFAPI